MVKERYVRNMQQARSSIVRQLHPLKLLVSGLDIDKRHFTPKLSETVFGKWFYSEALLFTSETSRHCLNDIEKSLLEFHTQFTAIYTLYYGKRACKLLELLRIKRKPSAAQRAAAQQLYEKIIPLSDSLRQQVNCLAVILEKMPNETFCQLSNMPANSRLSA